MIQLLGNVALAVAVLAIVSGCDGGGGDSTTPPPPPSPPPPGEPPANTPPLVEAGPDQMIELPDKATLVGRVTDDDLPDPPASVIATWTQQSGPGVASFSDSTSPATDVTFDTEGEYVLRLSADDSELSAVDEITVMVSSPPVPVLSAFTEITAEAGIGGPAHFGGHGAQFADVDDDGFADVHVTMNRTSFGDMGELFFRNENGQQFSEEATVRGIENFDTGSHGGVFFDYDNDGDLDLYNGSYEQNRLYANDGAGFFTDVTSTAGLPDRLWPTRGVAAIDIDRDGDLDLVGINGFRGSNDPADERNEIYRNDGDGTFTTDNLEPVFSAPAGQGLTDIDFDNDGYIDLFVANRTGDVIILRNQGGTGFEIVAPSNIGITHQADDGISFADVNNDRHLDALLDDQMYIADGDGTFTYRASFAGPELPYMGGFADLDNDGDTDLVFPGADSVYFNDGSGNFSPGEPFALSTVDDPRSVAFADIDNDGDVDFFYAQKEAFSILVRNDLSGGNHWLRVTPVRASGQLGGYGTRVYVYEAGEIGDPAGLVAWREARSQEGYLAQNDPRLHLGLGDNSIVDVRVIFPGGATVDLPNVAANREIVVQE